VRRLGPGRPWAPCSTAEDLGDRAPGRTQSAGSSAGFARGALAFPARGPPRRLDQPSQQRVCSSGHGRNRRHAGDCHGNWLAGCTLQQRVGPTGPSSAAGRGRLPSFRIIAGLGGRRRPLGHPAPGHQAVRTASRTAMQHRERSATPACSISTRRARRATRPRGPPAGHAHILFAWNNCRGDELQRAARTSTRWGVTLFYLLTGRTPVAGNNVVQLIANVLEQPVPSPRQYRPHPPGGSGERRPALPGKTARRTIQKL
jgi:hypothetical protein